MVLPPPAFPPVVFWTGKGSVCLGSGGGGVWGGSGIASGKSNNGTGI